MSQRITATAKAQHQQNGAFKIPLTSSNSQNAQKLTIGNSAPQSNAVSTATPKLEKTTSTLKSSVKRLFSPNSTTTTTTQATSSTLTLTTSNQPKLTTTTISLTPSTTKKYTRTTHPQGPCQSPVVHSGRANGLLNDDSTNKSLENLTTMSTSSTSSTTGDTHHTNTATTHTLSFTTNKTTKSVQNPIQAPRQTATSSLRKHLGLFKSKKSSQPTNAHAQQQSTNSNGFEPRSTSSSPPTPPPPQVLSFATQVGQHQLPPPPLLFQSPTKNPDDSIKTSDIRESSSKMKELTSEIERLSRLYDYEKSKQSKYEEKIQLYKQMAEEKQIESAALKYEYRKVQELNENLQTENTYLKNYIVHPATTGTSTSGTTPATLNLNLQTSSTSSNSSLNQGPSAGHLSAGTTVPSPRSTINHTNSPRSLLNSNRSNIVSSTPSPRNNFINQIGSSPQANSDEHQTTSYALNRPKSPSTSVSQSTSVSNMHQQQQQQSPVNSNYLHHSQHQHHANAAVQATADYFEQQFKMQQQKNFELEQQLRSVAEQNNEFKMTINNLTEINRQVYDENTQIKERNSEQRKQIEQVHLLLIEAKQSQELNQNFMQKKADDCLKDYQKELDAKKRYIQLIEQRQHAYLNEIKSINGQVDALKDVKYKLIDNINELKLNLAEQIKTIKSDFDGLIKHAYEYEITEIKEKFFNEKSELEQFKKQLMMDKQKLENEKYDLNINLNDLELKLEEIIKEKAQISYKYGQLLDKNRDLNQILNQREHDSETKSNELKEKLDFYICKCNDLEKEIAECQENHVKDTDEWKRFQADLQTAVRVANDFMNESEEKVTKMRDEYLKVKDRETCLLDELEKQKKKVIFYENKYNSYSNKLSKDNTDEPNLTSTSSLVRNRIEYIEHNNMSATTPPTTQPTSATLQNHIPSSSTTNLRHNSLSSSTSLPQTQSNYHPRSSTNSTDTDDIKLISSRVRRNSTSPQQPIPANNQGMSLSYCHSLQQHQDQQQHQANTTSLNILAYKISKQDATNTPAFVDPLASLVKQYGVSKRNALMKWCQEKTVNYKDLDIKNFSSSWNDGLAFCALLHSYLPQKIDFELLRQEKNPRKNFQCAFKLAQSIGIPQTLSIQDLLNQERPDWNAVMNYVTQIYKHFELSIDHRTDNTTTTTTTMQGNLLPLRSSSLSPTIQTANLTSSSSTSTSASSSSSSISKDYLK